MNILKKILFKFSLVILVLTSSICLAGPTIYLDDQKTIALTFMENSGEMSAFLEVLKFTAADISDKLLTSMRNELRLYVDGKSMRPLIRKNIGSQTVGNFFIPSDLYGKQMEFRLGKRVISRFSVSSKGKVNITQKQPITSYDLRQISEIGSMYVEKSLDTGEVPKAIIDLHTHFGGALRGESIVKVAFQVGLYYPTAYLKEMGISFDASRVNDKGEIKISDLDQKSLYKLIDSLNLNTLKVENFSKMEVYYKYRSPLVKSIEAFPLFLHELALDYQASGVKYAELSISDVLKPEWLELVHAHLPQIEKQTGVKIRFIAALWRHSDPLFNKDMIARLKVLQSPYIVGVDFMGHESNSTWELESAIKEAVELKKEIGSHFQIRVHAGENPYFPENVRVAIELGADRIGHALYADDTAVKLAQARETIFEINPDSNFALNNNDGAEQAPLKKFISAGVKITVGTDGHGLYGINHQNLFSSLGNSVNGTSLQQIVSNDAEYIRRMEVAFAQRKYLLNHPVSRNLPLPEYNEKYEQQQIEKRKQEKTELAEALAKKGIDVHTNTDAIESKYRGMMGIWISGASKSSFPKISSEDQTKIEQMLLSDLRMLDPAKVYLVMGITHFGVEEIIMRLNDQHKLGFKIVGTVAEDKSETNIADIGKVTDAIFMGKKWFDKAGTLVPFVKRNNMLTFFIGGGGVVRDEIQAAKNAGLDFYLLKGPWGASTDMSARYPNHTFDFSTGMAGMVSVKYPNILKISKSTLARSNIFKHSDAVKSSSGLKCIDFFR